MRIPNVLCAFFFFGFLLQSSEKPVITKRDLNNLKEQLERMQVGLANFNRRRLVIMVGFCKNAKRDKDRVRLVVAAAENFRVSCDQLKELVEMLHFGEAKNQTGRINEYTKTC